MENRERTNIYCTFHKNQNPCLLKKLLFSTTVVKNSLTHFFMDERLFKKWQLFYIFSPNFSIVSCQSLTKKKDKAKKKGSRIASSHPNIHGGECCVLEEFLVLHRSTACLFSQAIYIINGDNVILFEFLHENRYLSVL